MKITSEGETWVNASWAAPHFGQAYHPGLGAKWPRRVWWRRLAGGPQFRGGEPPLPRYRGVQHNVELPSKIRVMIGASIHLRWMVPVTEADTRVWTFTLVKKPKHALHAAWQALWYHGYRKPSIIIATNEQEDLVIFKRERLNLERPQKLGPLDVGPHLLPAPPRPPGAGPSEEVGGGLDGPSETSPQLDCAGEAGARTRPRTRKEPE